MKPQILLIAVVAALGALLAGGTLALAGGSDGSAAEKEYRPGKGCGDRNHVHTGPPGNPSNTQCPAQAGGDKGAATTGAKKQTKAQKCKAKAKKVRAKVGGRKGKIKARKVKARCMKSAKAKSKKGKAKHGANAKSKGKAKSKS